MPLHHDPEQKMQSKLLLQGDIPWPRPHHENRALSEEELQDLVSSADAGRTRPCRISWHIAGGRSGRMVLVSSLAGLAPRQLRAARAISLTTPVRSIWPLLYFLPSWHTPRSSRAPAVISR